MTKKISTYTAFGQFLKWIERELEYHNVDQSDDSEIQIIEQGEEQPTDRYLFDIFPLSDYQKLTSTPTEIKNLQIQSCPTVFDDKADYSKCAVRRYRSCPTIRLAPSPLDKSVSTESDYLNKMTTQMMVMFDVPNLAISPIPTSIESRKMNEATEKMVAFWKPAPTFVTIRRKRESKDNKHPSVKSSIDKVPSQPSLFENLNGYFDNATTSTPMPSLFEYLLPYFDNECSSQTLPSLFEKLNGLFAANPEVFTNEASSPATSPNFYKTFGNYLTSEDVDSLICPTEAGIGPMDHSFTCMCYTCWKMSATGFGTYRNSSVAPQLPVFVKSPVDSMRLYKCCPNPCSLVCSSASTSTSTNCSADVEDNCKTFTKSIATSPVFVPRRKLGVSMQKCPVVTEEDEAKSGEEVESDTYSSGSEDDCIIQENVLLQKKVELQMEIIQRLVQLNAITEKMSQL